MNKEYIRNIARVCGQCSRGVFSHKGNRQAAVSACHMSKTLPVVVITVLFDFFCAENVGAITLPGMPSILTEAAAIPILFLVSFLGGWYLLPAAKRRLRILCDALLSTFCLMLSCAGITLSVILYCLVRVILLIALRKESVVVLKRWLWAGVLLMLSCMLGYTALAFRGYEPLNTNAVNRAIDGLKVLVAYETAYLQIQKSIDKNACHTCISHINSGILSFRGNITATTTGYIIRVTPKLPWRPFNTISSAPLFIADESGAIRMCYVSRQDECPPDIPIVGQVSENEVQLMKEKIAKGMDYYDILDQTE